MRMDFRILVMRKRNYNQLKLVNCEMLQFSLGKKLIEHAVFGQRKKLVLNARSNKKN